MPSNKQNINVADNKSDTIIQVPNYLNFGTNAKCSEIIKKLRDVEQKNNIKIIYACDAGSKAWGSDSRDSDNDIRFIYVSPRSKYKEKTGKDYINVELNDEFDIHGFDLSKVIKEIKEQSYTPFEWLASPIKFIRTDFSDELFHIIHDCVNPSNMSGIYKKNVVLLASKQNKNNEKGKIKNYLLALKFILMADYIDKTGNFPPVKYDDLIETIKDDNHAIYDTMKNLLEVKKRGLKLQEVARIPILDDFIAQKADQYSKERQSRTEISPKKNETLNSFFDTIIHSSEFDKINETKLSDIDLERSKHFSLDNEYRKKILSDMGIEESECSTLQSIVGPMEFVDIISNFNNNPEVYSNGADNNQKSPIKNVINGTFRANLHIHTQYSDGKLSVQKLLDDAAKYADKLARNKNDINPLEPFTIAITDHNTVKGCREAIEIIKRNPEKYKNLRVVLGCELGAIEESSGDYTPKSPYQIHLLAQCINPFDEEMNNRLERKIGKNPYYATIGTMQEAVNILANQKFALIGYAHPLKHQSYKKAPSREKMAEIIKNLIHTFKLTKPERTIFVENYYQSYNTDLGNNKKIQEEVKEYCDANKLISTGGLDTHGNSIFYA